MTVSHSSFAERRRLLMDRIGPTSAALLLAAPERVRSNDVEYVYHPDNDLLYLTGFSEPGAACLLLPGHPEEEFILFVRPRDAERETWTGRRQGIEGAIASFGAASAYPIDQLDEKVAELVAERDQLYCALGTSDPELNEKILRWMNRWSQQRPRSGKGPVGLSDIGALVHEMRLRKSTPEIALMRRASEIGAEAHLAAMQSARPDMFEYEIEALVDYTFRRRGAAGPAYPSIVAGGANATILHYIANDQPLRDGDLLLIDAGAELGAYCSDITRTFPVGRSFSRAQRQLYDLVLEAQQAAIASIAPGVSFEQPHERAVEILVRGLLELGILEGESEEILEKHSYRRFYMHRTSHWLGMDVHDVGAYRDGDHSRSLETGMVLTVEPGIYIPAACNEVEACYRGIGIRIEDDVLVTSGGCEVLTASVPKDPVELEKIRSDALC